MELTEYTELMDLESNTLQQVVGETRYKENKYEDWGVACTEDLRIDIQRSWDGLKFSVDLISTFNKESQSPIHFCAMLERPPGKRKLRRLRAAISFLRTQEKIAGTFFGRLPGFDDLDRDSCQEFYHPRK